MQRLSHRQGLAFLTIHVSSLDTKYPEDLGHLGNTGSGLTHGCSFTKGRHLPTQDATCASPQFSLAKKWQDKATFISCRTDACAERQALQLKKITAQQKATVQKS